MKFEKTNLVSGSIKGLTLPASDSIPDEQGSVILRQGGIQRSIGNGNVKEMPVKAHHLYDMTSHTFTNAGATGYYGPTLEQCKSAYNGASWVNDTAFFNVSNGIQIWTVPEDGTYLLEAWGARGGDGTDHSDRGTPRYGGAGGFASGRIPLVKGDILYIGCGHKGGNGIVTSQYTFNGGAPPGNTSYAAGQGGGATHIATAGGQLQSVPKSNVIIVAGGGGGGGNGSIGGDGGGTSGQKPPSNTQFSGRNSGNGGTQTSGGASGGAYGEGGIAGQNLAGGGGGGWYGGGGGANSTGGGGGSGRLNVPTFALTDTVIEQGGWNGAGKVVITKLQEQL